VRRALALLLLAGCTSLGRPDHEVVQPGGYRLDVRGATDIDFEEARRAVQADLRDFKERGAPRPAADDGAWSLEQLLGARGHPFASVDWRVETAADGLPTVIYEIDPGPRVRLAAVSFRGNTALSDEELAAIFETPDGTYVESRVAASVASAAAMYVGRGYLQAQVGPASVSFSEDRAEARVVVPIVENTPQHVARIVVGGETGLPAEELEQSMAEFVGQPYFPQVAFAVRTRLLDRVGDAGYPEATATFSERSEQGAVELGFTVQCGPRVGIADVKVHGTSRMSEEFVKERLRLHPGDRWSTSADRASETALQRSSLFDKVRLALETPEPGEPASELQPGDAPRTLVVEVEEAPLREYFVEPGYGSYEGLRMVAGYRDRGLNGEGLTLHAEAAISAKVRRALVGLTDPWLFPGPDISGDISVFDGVREEPSFDRHEIGFALTFGHEFSARDSAWLVWALKRTKVSNVQVDDPDVLDAEQTVDVGSLALTGQHDSRDSVFAPTHGVLARITPEVGSQVFGGEIDFLRGRLELADFWLLAEGSVLAASFRTGLISPTGSTDDIPIQERFFNGGQDTVRSFREDELGPKDANGNPLGGETFSVLSIEWRRRLRGDLGGALFVDAGNVLADAGEYFTLRDVSYALGAGLRYQLPVGPIRFDIGWNPWPGEDEDDWVAHLSVGMAF
jgi:outer membrane protein insertion porin family